MRCWPELGLKNNRERTTVDDKVVDFPLTEEERQDLRKAKQDRARQDVIDKFVDEPNGLFHTPDGHAYADLLIEGSRQTWAVRSKQFRFAYMRYVKQVQQKLDEAPQTALALKGGLSKSAVNAAIDKFEMKAMVSKIERNVHLRVASDSGDLFVDCCDSGWRTIRITGAAWRVIEGQPVRFRRTRGMLKLPFPQRGTPIQELRPFLNVSDSDFVLVVAFILAALRNQGPYPILVLNGEQGTAKSSFARIVRSLIDPSSVPLSSLPPSSRDLFIAANNQHVLSFENLSKLTPTMSDNLCRLATGGGFRVRTLYKDSDETLFDASRPIILNGISNFVTRGDLQDRAIVLPLSPISDRRTEKELFTDFERKRAGIFGALLDLMVRGVRMLPETHLINSPRMADFATWAVACGLEGFEGAYASNRQNAIDVLLEHDLLAKALMTLVLPWKGTAQSLLYTVGPAAKIANPKVLSDELRRLTPMLRTVGIEVSHERTAERRLIRIKRR
jgi:hypothetical protein